MSTSAPAQTHGNRGGGAKLWLGLLLLVAAGIGLAWLGAGSLRGETTPSGLQFRTIEAGSGPYVQAVDGVLVEYEGRLMDGTIFDESGSRGPQPMIAGQVIPGFAEALTKMQKGGRYRIQIPSKLAYGAEPPAGSPIPANADLEFDVHIAQLVPNAALMTGPPQQPQGQPAPGDQAPPQPQ
jgi:FKBP-type peptidyl-prolyl cis-trans isomerase FkpA